MRLHQQLTYSACPVVCQAQCRTDLRKKEISVAARRDKAGATARRRWIRAWPAYSHAEYAPPPCRSPTAVGGTRHPCHAASPGHAIPLVPTETLEPAPVWQALFRPVNTSQGSGDGRSQKTRQVSHTYVASDQSHAERSVECPVPASSPPHSGRTATAKRAGLPLYRINPPLVTIRSLSCPPLHRIVVT